MTTTPRSTIDAAYTRLRDIKSSTFARIFEYGEAQERGDAVTLDPDVELATLYSKYGKFREWIAMQAESSLPFRSAAFEKCRNGLDGMIFWFEIFAFTFDPRKDECDIVFVLWPNQEGLLKFLWDGVIAKRPGAIDKPRDMGFSYCCVYFAVWFWTFRENSKFLFGSYREELADKPHNPNSLLGKADYCISKLPSWMKPKNYNGNAPERTFKYINNFDAKGTLSAEATSPRFGRAARAKVVFLDEYGHWDVAEEARRSVGRTTNILFFLSTSNGLATQFGKMVTERKIPIYETDWWDHPEWQRGRRICKKGECQLEHHKEGGFKHSDKFDVTAADMYGNNSKMIAQEMERNHLTGGGTVFPASVVQKMMEFLIKNPPKITKYRLEWVADTKPILANEASDPWAMFRRKRDWGVKAIEFETGPVAVIDLPFSCRRGKCLCRGTGHHVYVLGGDVCKGLPDGDNDSGCIIDCTLGKVVCEYEGRSNALETGDYWARLMKWYGVSGGGYRNCYGAIEWNDQGLIVNQALDECGMSLHVSISEDKIKKRMTQNLGIVVGANKTRLVEKNLYPAICTMHDDGYPMLCDEFIGFWQELSTFIYVNPMKQGQLRPDKPKMGAAWGAHDDRVMGREHGIHGAISAYGKFSGVVNELDVAKSLRGHDVGCAIRDIHKISA